MIRKKIKMGVFLRVTLIIISLSSLFIMSSAASVSALSLNDTKTVASVNDINCAYDINPLTWLICPLIDGMSALVEGFDTYITSALTINVCTYFNSSLAGSPACGSTTVANPDCKITQTSSQATVNNCTSNGFYTAWSAFRDMALGLMVIGALIMVISQILGFEIFDAYTIRKVLPRIIIAAIGISLSWQLVQFLILFSNDLGNGVRELIYSPFQFLNNTGVIIKGGTSSAAFILGAGAIAVMGIIATLTFVLVALVAAFMGFAVIVLRQILIIFLAVLAPLAIVMFILPATEKLWKLWWNTFFKALIMFPLIIGMIAIGRVFAAISSQDGGNVGQFVAFLAYFGPYFIIPSTFKFAGGILGAAGGAVGRVSKSVSKSQAGYRSKKRKEIHEKRAVGDTRLSSGRSGNVYRRMTTSGGLSPFAKGRAKYEARNQLNTRAAAKKSLEQDGGVAAGDDIATGLAMQQGMTGGQFVKDYATLFTASELKKSGRVVTAAEATTQARSALATTQTNFGTRMGSQGMQLAAATARFSSSPGAYTPDDAGMQSLYRDAGSMVKRGLLSETAAAQAIKGNKSRVDQSAASFPDIMKTIHNSAVSGSGPSLAEVSQLRSSALQGANPSEFIGAHANSVKALVPQMGKNLDAAVASGNSKSINLELAKIDSIYTNIGSGSPKAATILSDELLTKNYTNSSGGTISVREAIELARSSDDFKNYKASFGPPPSDLRLKENIIFVGTVNGYRHYSFNYIFDNTIYVGVMAQEILKQKPEAVIKQRNGYYAVDYQMLGLEMYTISEWQVKHLLNKITR